MPVSGVTRIGSHRRNQVNEMYFTNLMMAALDNYMAQRREARDFTAKDRWQLVSAFFRRCHPTIKKMCSALVGPALLFGPIQLSLSLHRQLFLGDERRPVVEQPVR